MQAGFIGIAIDAKKGHAAAMAAEGTAVRAVARGLTVSEITSVQIPVI